MFLQGSAVKMKRCFTTEYCVNPVPALILKLTIFEAIRLQLWLNSPLPFIASGAGSLWLHEGGVRTVTCHKKRKSRCLLTQWTRNPQEKGHWKQSPLKTIKHKECTAECCAHNRCSISICWIIDGCSRGQQSCYSQLGLSGGSLHLCLSSQTLILHPLPSHRCCPIVALAYLL